MIPARLSKYCRQEWSKSSECEGLCSLCLEWKRMGVHLDKLPDVIARYLIPHELVVWTRKPVVVDLDPGEKQRCYLQVVDAQKKLTLSILTWMRLDRQVDERPLIGLPFHQILSSTRCYGTMLRIRSNPRSWKFSILKQLLLRAFIAVLLMGVMNPRCLLVLIPVLSMGVMIPSCLLVLSSFRRPMSPSWHVRLEGKRACTRLIRRMTACPWFGDA